MELNQSCVSHYFRSAVWRRSSAPVRRLVATGSTSGRTEPAVIEGRGRIRNKVGSPPPKGGRSGEFHGGACQEEELHDRVCRHAWLCRDLSAVERTASRPAGGIVVCR